MTLELRFQYLRSTKNTCVFRECDANGIPLDPKEDRHYVGDLYVQKKALPMPTAPPESIKVTIEA